MDFYKAQVFIKNELLNFQMYLISIFMNEFFIESLNSNGLPLIVLRRLALCSVLTSFSTFECWVTKNTVVLV